MEVQLNYEQVFIKSPLFLDYIRVQMVVPTFSALLSDASRQQRGDLSPVFSSVLLYKLSK